MGYYINPKNKTKEEWLLKNAQELTKKEAFYSIADNKIAILVWINNGPFTACGIAFSEDEFLAFTMESDHRPKKFFVIEREKLKEVVEDYEYIEWEF